MQIDMELVNNQKEYLTIHDKAVRYIFDNCNYMKSADKGSNGLRKSGYPEVPGMLLICRNEAICTNHHCLLSYCDYDDKEGRDYYYYETNH